MNPILEQLMNVALEDAGAFRVLADRYSQEITPELADEAHAVFMQASQAGQIGFAAAATVTASNLYLRLGNHYQGLRHFILFQQVRYMAASSADLYQDVRQHAAGLIKNAEEIGALDLAFETATLAANCSFFTADLQDTPGGKEAWLRQTLADLITASRYGPQAGRDGLEQFVSLLGGFAESFTTLVPTPDAALEQELRLLTQAVEGFVPVDFQFRIAGDARKSAANARWLAVLSRRFGSSENARRRLELHPRS